MPQSQTLVRLQECDTEMLRLKKQLEELPEAAGIMECRAKRKELKAKQDQVVELSDDVNQKLIRLQTEQERVAAKIDELQATLDSTSDYRVTASVTRDMDGQVKRQGALAEELDALLERQIKVEHLAEQVAGALARVDGREGELSAAFREKGGKLKARMNELSAERADLISKLDEPLARKYERILAEKSGIGIARLEDGHCSVCRAEIMEGQLRRLQAGPAVAECPNCRRLFIVREEE